MTMENQNKGKIIVGSLLVGALVGATVGVLFAPHKGKKTRKKTIPLVFICVLKNLILRQKENKKKRAIIFIHVHRNKNNSGIKTI
jgi:gas vesicle protein